MYVVVRGIKADGETEPRSRFTTYIPDWRARRLNLDVVVRQVLDDADVSAVDVWSDDWAVRTRYTRSGDLVEQVTHTVADDGIEVPRSPLSRSVTVDTVTDLIFGS